MDGTDLMGAPKSTATMLSAATDLKTPLVMGIRLGRGRTGGSTFMDMLIQRARACARKVVIADGDLRNSTLAGLYPPEAAGGALQPQSDDVVDMKDLFTAALGRSVEEKASLLVDFGGGDRVMLEYGRELSLVEMADGLGLEPLAIYVTGPDIEDFDHILSLWRSGVFRPEHSLLVLNEHLVPNGRSPEGAFRGLMSRPEFVALAGEGLRPIVMPRLPCMSHVRDARLNLMDAMNGRPGRTGVPLDPVRRFMVKTWLKRLETIFSEEEVLEWLP
jgi:hypothetical protein